MPFAARFFVMIAVSLCMTISAQAESHDRSASAAPEATSPAPSSEVNKALEAARQAELDLRLGAVRAGLLRARAELLQAHHDEAVAIAMVALDAVDHMPDGVDKVALAEPLQSIIDQAQQAQLTTRQSASTPASSLTQVAIGHAAGTQSSPAGVTVQVGGTGTMLDVWAQTDVPDWAIENRRILSSLFLYPADWDSISAHRSASYSDGIIYAGPETIGQDGQTRQTVIYDVQALVTPIPSSSSAPHYSLRESTRNLADRVALRDSSMIFRGSAHDLAAGLPLLHYFGGVDDANVPYPDGQEEYERLLELIDLVIDED